jgi:hypothetical protein
MSHDKPGAQRSIYSTYTSGKLRVVHHAVISDDIDCAYKIWGCLIPCTCFLYEPLRAALKESSYVQVLENRVEWNQPYSYCTGDCLCPWRVNCHVVDNTKVLYLDRALALNVAKVEMCSPVCTHNDCIPTCCDMCGESIIMYENVTDAGCMECLDCFTCCHVYNVRANVGQRPRTCCSAEHVRIDCLADAQCTPRDFPLLTL